MDRQLSHAIRIFSGLHPNSRAWFHKKKSLYIHCSSPNCSPKSLVETSTQEPSHLNCRTCATCPRSSTFNRILGCHAEKVGKVKRLLALVVDLWGRPNSRRRVEGWAKPWRGYEMLYEQNLETTWWWTTHGSCWWVSYNPGDFNGMAMWGQVVHKHN